MLGKFLVRGEVEILPDGRFAFKLVDLREFSHYEQKLVDAIAKAYGQEAP